MPTQESDRRLNIVIIIAYTTFGATLILQPDRYSNTPSYANLFDIMPQWAWGVIYLVVAIALWASIRINRNRAVIIGVYTAAAVLTSVWLVAFVVRYLTNNGTTIVNVVSWSVFLTLVIMSGLRQVDQLRPDVNPTDPAPVPTAVVADDEIPEPETTE